MKCALCWGTGWRRFLDSDCREYIVPCVQCEPHRQAVQKNVDPEPSENGDIQTKEEFRVQSPKQQEKRSSWTAWLIFAMQLLIQLSLMFIFWWLCYWVAFTIFGHR